MSNDLINRSALIEVLNNGGAESTEIHVSHNMELGEIVDIVIAAYRKCLFAEIEKIPTAYDVDKVVEQLEERTYREYGRVVTRDAIEIVKAGMKG